MLAEKSETTRGFVPELRVSMAVIDGQVVVRLRDSGKGIPARELSKLFTPFFTIKLTAKSTGLSLLMAKNMMEPHQGQLSLDTREGNFTAVTLTLLLVEEGEPAV